MSRPSSLVVLIAFFVARAAHGQGQGFAPPETADELFAHGVERHQAGDTLGAIEAYKEALAKEPDRIDARSNLGAAYVRLGRYEDAVEQYRKALEKNPGEATVRFNLALALYKGAMIPEAATELATVVGQSPANVSALLLLADCHLQLGQDAKVVGLLMPHEAELRGNRLFNYLLGSALLARNELLRGQELIDRLFQGGETAEGHLLLAAAHVRRHDSKSAVPELERAIELDPKLPTLHSLYGRALLGTGQRPEAALAFRAELEANPNDFDSNLYLGLMLKDEDKLDESYDHLKRAARLRPQDPGVLYGLGGVHLAAGRVDEAQKALEVVTAKVPDYQQGHVLLATVYYRQKKKDLGDRERALVERLKEKQQAQEAGARAELGPAYKGEDVTPDLPARPAEPSAAKGTTSKPGGGGK